MSDQETIRKIFEDFVLADEVDQVSTAFSEILSLSQVNPDDIIDLKTQVFEQIADTFEGEVKFRHQKLFEVIREALGKRASFRQPGSGDHKVFLSGAGPCGLRTAVECALLGFQVTLVEKRQVFSRANILTLWTQTKSDLVALGAKFFYPEMKTQGFPLHLGTREMQLCLLKISLLLGVDVRYETELVGFNYDTSQNSWVAQVKPRTKKKAEKVAPVGLDFKPLKTGDYQKTYVCNMVDKVQVDEEFIQTDLKGDNGATTIPFHACVVAEGEWSQTCRKLGFEKTIDKFNQALGIVINMEFDRENKQENKLKSFTSSLMYNSKKIGGDHLDNLKAAGIICENLEYLKGTTHYFALTVKKESLLEAGIFKEDKMTSDLLTDSNLDYDSLETLAKKISVICGLPEETKFYKVNPVQIFDFSTRARARLPMKFLKASKSDGQVSVVSSLPKSEDETDKFAIAPIYPVGDALLEPFWPQGLGSNRGFHTCLDTSHSILLLHTRGPKAAFDERIFSHCTMLETPWGVGPMALNKFQYWSTDPLTRYSPDTLKNGYRLVKRKKRQLPQRFESPQIFKTVENILGKLDSGVPRSKATFDADESGCVVPLLDY